MGLGGLKLKECCSGCIGFGRQGRVNIEGCRMRSGGVSAGGLWGCRRFGCFTASLCVVGVNQYTFTDPPFPFA